MNASALKTCWQLCLPDRIFREIGKINAHNDFDPASDYQEWYKVAQQAEKRLDHQPPLYTKIEKMRNNSRSKPSEKDKAASDKEKSEKDKAANDIKGEVCE